MKRWVSTNVDGTAWSRRRFVEGAAAGSILAGAGGWFWSGMARSAAPVLVGSDFELEIGTHPVNVTGRPGLGSLVNASLPAPTLRWREGDTVSIRVRNALAEPTSIHWHGLLLPANMDGVPGLSFDGIEPGAAFEYRFDVRQSGTYWYHTHSGFQEQTGLYGALIIEPSEPAPYAYERDHVVLLSDWSDLEPAQIYGLLKKQSDYFNYNRPTFTDFKRRAAEIGFRAAWAERAAWRAMRMDPSDLADVSGATYTYLMNGRSPGDNWTGLFAPGERIRLRFINGSAMTYFDVRIPGVEMTVVAADGQDVHPVAVDEFRLGVAEVLDVIVAPTGAEAFTIFAQAMDRSGYARGTLAVREGISAPVPALDAIEYLTMADMGHGGIEHPVRPATPAASDRTMSTMDHAAMGHATAAAPSAGVDDSSQTGGPDGAAIQSHPDSERGNPGIDMQAMAPAARLDDPGVGLRNNGRRVLTYADLGTRSGDPDGREPGRTIELHLTGHMGRYMWSFDGVRFSDAEPIRLVRGERVRLVLVNDTMMEHPIHLHGLWSDLENDRGEFQLRKHTITMPPGTRRSYRVAADALGRWAYHCHLLYHMEAGMFREIRVESSDGSAR